jgi:hypothetical protein
MQAAERCQQSQSETGPLSVVKPDLSLEDWLFSFTFGTVENELVPVLAFGVLRSVRRRSLIPGPNNCCGVGLLRDAEAEQKRN